MKMHPMSSGNNGIRKSILDKPYQNYEYNRKEFIPTNNSEEKTKLKIIKNLIYNKLKEDNNNEFLKNILIIIEGE